MPSLWKRITSRVRAEAIEEEIEKEGMTPEERRLATGGVENLADERFAEEHFGVEPQHLDD